MLAVEPLCSPSRAGHNSWYPCMLGCRLLGASKSCPKLQPTWRSASWRGRGFAAAGAANGSAHHAGPQEQQAQEAAAAKADEDDENSEDEEQRGGSFGEGRAQDLLSHCPNRNICMHVCNMDSWQVCVCMQESKHAVCMRPMQVSAAGGG